MRDGVGEVEVEGDVLLAVQPGIEVPRRLRTERGVDGVLEEEVRFMDAVTGAGVPGQAGLRDAPEPGDRRHVRDDAAEAGREAPRRDLLEREAVGVREHLGERTRIRHVVRDPHRGTVRRAPARRLEHVPDEQRLTAVERVDVLPRVRVPEVETLGHLLVRVAGMAVELHVFGEQAPEIAE